MKVALLIIIIFFTEPVLAQCASSGPANGSIFSNNTSVGTIAWNNALNAEISDDLRSAGNFSIGLLSSATTNYLIVSGFGFSIPSIASVCGIRVEVEKRYNLVIGLLSSIADNSIRIVKGGAIVGENKATGSGWPSTDAYSTYGSSSDLWGVTWTPADINVSNFGVAVSATVSSGLAALSLNTQIDHVRITIYYSMPLPVTFKDFWAEPVTNKIKLQWSTLTEINSSHFIVEKMSVATNAWYAIDSIPAAFTSYSEKFYEAYDANPESMNIYRIRQLDLDGKYMFSKTISVRYKKADHFGVNIFPNPVYDNLTIHSTQVVQSLMLTDISGKSVFENKGKLPVNPTMVSVSHLQPGIYFLVVETNKGRSVQKVVIASRQF